MGLTDDATAVVVPTAAVQVGQQGQYAFVVKEDHSVEYRTVTVERMSGLDSVIKEGLKAGETVSRTATCAWSRAAESASRATSRKVTP